MSPLLDLSITLTPPPAGSPPEAIASIALSCAAFGLSHTGDLLTDPLTDKEREELLWYLEEYWHWPYEGFAERGKKIEALLPQIGKRLYNAVFGSHEADRMVQKWLAKTKKQQQISILSTMPRVLSLPWELLQSEQGYMALRTGSPISIIRSLPQSEISEEVKTSFKPPLRILLVTARPEDTGFVDPRGIARELLDEVDKQIEPGAVELEFLRPPTLPALRARLSDSKRPIHILHFDGHGTFEEKVALQASAWWRTGQARF